MDKIKGCIYGVLVGDALGTTYEFEKETTIMLSKTLNIVGGGPFNVAIGQLTDDSEMTLALAYSIINKKKYDKEDVAKAYIRWLKSDPIDNGISTAKALRKAKNFQDTVNNSIKYNSKSLSNGFLMRISPLAVIGKNMDKYKLNKIIKDEISITHSNKECLIAGKFYIYLLIYILNGGEDYYNYSLQLSGKDYTLKKIVEGALKSPYYIRYKNVKIDVDGQYMGYYVVSLQIALYCLFNSKTYQSAMRTIIKLGGDTDTNCAISGALLGAKFGYNKIPKKWLKTILEADYDRPEEFKLNEEKLKLLFNRQ